jgi:leucyl-tRNA synthetase
MKPYDPKDIETKQQEKWRTSGIYKVTEDATAEKAYILDMFPYPSGEGLHVGHPKGYIASDVYSRMKRMQGYSVLHPMGWDAFGLPAELFAIKNKVHPSTAVARNTKRFKEQLEKIGFDYDWDHEINTTDPEYYRWTQWIFLKLFEKGLAYESYEPINWCPTCQTGLANEDLEGGKCERCETVVEKKPMRQWVLRITDYADRMLEDLELLTEWPESVKEMQRQWIGRSEGAHIEFKIKGTAHSMKVFTTRPDTLFGCTYCVLSPEHHLVEDLRSEIKNWDEVFAYQKEAKAKTEIERTDMTKEKTGVLLEGVTAINPANGEEVSVYVADYVLAQYGTGAIMAVPAHDERDHAFAKKYNLPITEVIAGGEDVQTSAYTGEGKLINSDSFNGLTVDEAKQAITKHSGGKLAVTYRLQEWVFSRQRYWGEPIPLVHCDTCGVVPVSEEDLPVRLPDVESYAPTGTGESPLASIDEWVNTTCPKCDAPGKRETNTMPQWAGSSWYYLRYMDPHNDQHLVAIKKEKYWAPVDMYVGGMEHATRHLIYARFWHKFLYDEGVVSTKEPFMRLKTVGLIQAEDGRKMSKRWGNVINPDDVVARMGADTLRVYEMFMGPFGQAIAWSTDDMVGSRRFIEKVWRLQERVSPGGEHDVVLLNQTIKKVTDDISSFDFNTAVAAMMVLANDFEKRKEISQEAYRTLIQLLAPFAPHVADEIWEDLGEEGSVHVSAWPRFDETLLVADTVMIAVQINGKVRSEVQVSSNASEAEVTAAALSDEMVQKFLEGTDPKRIIYVPGRLLSIVQ